MTAQSIFFKSEALRYERLARETRNQVVGDPEYYDGKAREMHALAKQTEGTINQCEWIKHTVCRPADCRGPAYCPHGSQI